MRNQLLGLLLLSTTFIHCGHSLAANSAKAVTPPSQEEAFSLLNSDDYSELDRRYSEIQNGYKAGLITDEDLRAAFRVFYVTNSRLEPKYAQWVAKMPQSYVAHLARGIYYKKLGQERRGNNFISDTTDSQLRGMGEAFKIASKELRASFVLDNKPILSYLHAIDISNFTSQPDESRRLLELSIKIDAHNFIVREKYMGTLQTRWGGSVEEMSAFLDECKKANISPAHIQQLQSLVVEDRAWVEKHQKGDLNAAAKNYLKAGKLNPKGNCLVCAAEALRDQGKYGQAIKIYSEALAVNPKSADTYYNRGFTYLQLHKSKEAMADFEQAGNLGSATAQDSMGRLYLLGVLKSQDGGDGIKVAPDRDKGIDWLQKAANQGYAPAKQLLPIAMNKAIELSPQPEK